MNMRFATNALVAGPRRTWALLLLAGTLLALVPLAGRAQAGVSDYPSPLYLTGPVSSVTGHAASYRLSGSLWAAPTASVSAGASTLFAGTYRYVYTVDSGSGETPSAGATATVTTTNGEVVTVSGLPTGAGTVRLYRMNLSNPTNCYTRVTPMGFAADSFTDTSGTSSCTNALKRSEDRFPASTTGWTELSPSTVAPLIGNSPVIPAVPAAPNRKGWIVDGAGQVSFPNGPWTFEVQTRSIAADGSAALLVVGMWKVDSATGNPVGAPVLPPTEQVQAPPNLISGANVLQTVTITVDVPAFSLEANERLYVQFWRHQTTAYLGTTGAANRVATMFGWDGAAKISHPAANAYATEPTPVAPAAGAFTASRDLTAVFNDADPSDSGTVEFRLCTDAASAGSACSALAATGSSGTVAKGAAATWSGPVLTHGATYYWQARGRDALGGTSAWTATQSFKADAAPNTPAQLGPAAGVAARSLALEASYSDQDGDPGVLEIRLCSAEASAGVECSGLVLTGWFNSLASGQSVKWTPPEPLADGVYHWQARAGDVLGAVSAWTATRPVRIDTTPPAAPDAFGGAVAQDGLTLRWAVPPGGEEIASYVVYVDGQPWRTLSGQTYESKLGTFDAADTRRFSVAAIDVAGNTGARTSTLVGVPDLVGLTRDEARAAVVARGLVLRDETARSMRATTSRAHQIVIDQTPDVPSLAMTGSTIDIVLAAPKANALLRFTKLGASCSQGRQLVVRIWLRESAPVTVTLLDRGKARAASWRLGRLDPGEHKLTLKLPSSVRRAGHYRVSVLAKGAKPERLSRPFTLGRNALRGRCPRT